MKKSYAIVLVSTLPLVSFAAADIDVQKSVDNAFPLADEPVEFTIDVRNIGDEAAAGVVIVDLLPPGLSIPDGTAAFTSVGDYDPDTGEWTIGDLDARAAAVMTIPATVTSDTPPDCVVNAAISQFADGDADSNDEGRAAVHPTGVERCVDLDVTFGISVGDPGQLLPVCDSSGRYHGDVSVTNHGPDAARDVRVRISQSPSVGPNLRFDDFDCDNAPGPECTINEIRAGQTVSIDVTSNLFQSYQSYTQTLSVTASTRDVDYEATNNSPSVEGVAGGFSQCIDFGIEVPGIVGVPACFIATAAYGSPMHAKLDTLRNFRDRYLLTNAPGREFVRLYYRYSPPIADFIAERGWLRAVVRGLLAPLVFAIENPGYALLALFAGAALIRLRRRRTTALPM